jgi:sigma54-dependent transcription regulator
MANENDSNKDRFLYPIGKYYGKFTPEKLAFNANLQEFAQRVVYLCGLETNGKITTKEAYQEIKKLWQQLEESKQELLKDDEASDKDG